MISLEEKKELCSKALVMWVMEEHKGTDFSKHSPDVAEMFMARMLLKKFEVFGVDIILPDLLILILDMCTESNPGQTQIILKDLLESIKKHSGKPIPKGYTVSSMDFSLCFPNSFPITEIDYINDKYMKMWDGQKREVKNILESDNKCDTPEWWLEVME
jgi:hypothetical protein